MPGRASLLRRRDVSRSPSLRPGERGVTLLETLIAVAVLSVGMLGLLQLLASSIQLHQLARNREEASRLATAKVEELSKLDFSSAAIQVTPASPEALETNVANHFDTPAAGFTRRWRVGTGPTNQTRVVTVRLVPASADRRLTTRVEVTTIIRQW